MRSIEAKLHSLMRGDEAVALVEAARIAARLVGGELDDAAAVPARTVDCVGEELAADAGTARRSCDAHALDLRAPGALVGEAGEEGELEACHDRARFLADDQVLVRIGVDRG